MSLGAGLVRTTIRLADAGSAGVLRIGDRINVLAVPATDPAGDRSARVIARQLTVLALPAPHSADDPGGLVVVAAAPSVATTLAQAATDRLSVTSS